VVSVAARTGASPARRISVTSVNEVVPMRETQAETSSTSSKRAGDFHSSTWRTVWHSKVPSMPSVGRGRAARRNSKQAMSAYSL
jgi:hypothetical protein